MDVQEKRYKQDMECTCRQAVEVLWFWSSQGRPRHSKALRIDVSELQEEYSERLRLITDIASRMEDYKQNLDVRAELEEKKREGLVSSGDVVRKLALNNIANHGNDESADEDSDVEDFEESKQKAPKKRKNKAEGRRHSKRQTRRDTLDTLVSTITAGLNTMKQNDEEIAKIQRERLEFDREEARKSLEKHTAFMKLIQDITAGRNQAKP
ncbi:hypothetical protein AC1031_011444 [Aphanomyces cochlioides]|nr:hypothetical protein AC1031_011444 [Aphanomyces cochlioides]